MKILAIIALAGTLMLVGCATLDTPVQPPMGCLYTNIKAPLSVDYAGAKVPAKTGSASTEFIALPFITISWGDASVDAAAKDGNIRNIEFSDYEYMSVLGVYAKYTTHVRGE